MKSLCRCTLMFLLLTVAWSGMKVLNSNKDLTKALIADKDLITIHGMQSVRYCMDVQSCCQDDTNCPSTCTTLNVRCNAAGQNISEKQYWCPQTCSTVPTS